MSRSRATWRGDLLLIAVILALAGGGFAWQALRPAPAQRVIVETPTETRVLPLDQDTILTLTGDGDLTVTVEIRNGAARFAASDCPDGVCVHTGWLSRAGATAACVPAGILLRIDGEAEVDAVAS